MKKLKKSILSLSIASIMIGCGTETSKNDATSLQTLLSSGTLIGTTKSTIDDTKTKVKISKDASNNYTVEYPQLSCKGTLEIISASATEMIFKIHFTEGSCPSGTKLKLTSQGNNQVRIEEYGKNTTVPTTDTSTAQSSSFKNRFALIDGAYHTNTNYSKIRVYNNGSNAEVDYPNDGCTAKWTSIPSNSSFVMRFKQEIISGKCSKDDIVDVRKNSDRTFETTWFNQYGEKQGSRYNIYYDGDRTKAWRAINRPTPFPATPIYGKIALRNGAYHTNTNYSKIRVYNNGSNAEVDYPNDGCTAKWTSIPSNSSFVMRFKQEIISGKCSKDDIVDVRKNSDRMFETTWFNQYGEKQGSRYNIYYDGDRTKAWYNTNQNNLSENSNTYKPTAPSTNNTQNNQSTQNPTPTSTNYSSSKEAEYNQYIKEYYAHFISFTYVSDDHTKAIAVARHGDVVNMYLWNIYSNKDPEINYEITPPNSDDQWISINNIQKVDEGKITFNAKSRYNSERNYTYNFNGEYYQ